ncbi:hypothetical protein [Spirosoma pollinicola]|uniref:Nuclease-associated modular DNA-binding 1 domain-containing protein n=1 Tax=Spirosoma pollinicola TaxID=2057025 RepID=A0A2K8YTM3_9BACT|nr:hypothetical protein [Spirosoma pollinicola]AUD00971.1 hypothetical protein CWM47_03540 [Spirosoma pollinicola]
MPATTNRVGTSSFKPYTPAGEKHLPKSSIENLIPCIHFGPIKSGVIYVRPGHVRYQMEKYKALNEGFRVPASYDVDTLEPTAVTLPSAEPTAPRPRPARNAKSRPVICLNTGRFFDSVSQVANAYKLSTQILNYHLSGKGAQCKGRRLRFATPEEITQAEADMNWTYPGELLPMGK